MDLVYSVGRRTEESEWMLRASIASVRRFAANVGKIVVAGFPPEWLDADVERFPVKPRRNDPKQTRILKTVLAVIDAGLVSGEFLYSSDDHFLVKDVDFDRFPYYWKRREMAGFDDIVRDLGIQGWCGYYRSITETRDLLDRYGYAHKAWHGHVNTHMHTADAAEVRRLMGLASMSREGLEPTCMFMNVRTRREPIEGTFREDCKVGEWRGEDALWEAVGDRDTFSIAPSAIDSAGEFRRFMWHFYAL